MENWNWGINSSKKNHARDWQFEELKRICCAETDRARQASIDELSMHQERNPTTVSQLLTLIQEWKNKANSPSDSTGFCETELGSSSEATHVPSQPSTMPSPRTMPRRDSGLPHDPPNITDTSGNVFDRPSAQRRTIFYSLQQFIEFGILFSRIKTWYYMNYKETREWNEKRTVEYVSPITPFPKWRWYVESYWWNLFPQWYDGLSETPDFGNAYWTISRLYGVSKLEKSTSRLKYVRNQQIFVSQCTGSKKLRQQKSTDEFVTSRTIVGRTDFTDFDLLNTMIASALKGLSNKHILFRKRVSKRSVLKNTTDSYVGDKLLAWSLSIPVQQELMKR